MKYLCLLNLPTCFHVLVNKPVLQTTRKIVKNKLYFLYRILITSLTPRKIRNFIKIKLSYLLSKVGILTDWHVFPLFISIEPVDICNLKCPECPVGMRQHAVKATNIDTNTTKKIFDELAPTLTHAILYFQGEPLINKEFGAMVKYARAKNILTSTSTNAQLINSARAKELVESGLDKIIISMDGATQETYEAYRVGGKLEKATEAIKWLNHWKKELKSASPFIEIQFIVFGTNEHELKAMRKLANELNADRLAFKSAQLYDFENGSSLMPKNKKYARYKMGKDGKYHIKSALPNRCRRLWEGSVLTSRADILPCCFDKDSHYRFGNIHEQPFDETWRSTKANEFRKAVLSDRKQFEMCRNCSER